jgi:uncharacterized iron-regulated membrane protein
MKRFRTIIFWCHLTAGVSAGLVILVMSVTGALLAFEPQIERFAEREMRTIQPPSAEARRLSVQELFAKAREAKPEMKPTALTLQADPTAAASFTLGREGVLYLNPYTGAVTGEGAKGVRAFFRGVTDWHRWLGAGNENRALGKAVTGACNAAFLVLAITGVYIWWPKRLTWRQAKPVMVFKRGLKGRARDFNWHNVIGFWSSSILIILTATGLVISYQWASNLLYRVTGNEPPAQQAPPGATNPAGQNAPPRNNQGAANRNAETPSDIPANLNQLWARAEQQVPAWHSMRMSLPPRAGAPVSFAIEDGTSWNPMARSQLTLDATTGEVAKWEPYTGLNAGRKLRTWARFAHTGEAGRWPGQLIAFLASAGGAVLVYTGLALAWRRFRAWLARRKGININNQPEAELS